MHRSPPFEAELEKKLQPASTTRVDEPVKYIPPPESPDIPLAEAEFPDTVVKVMVTDEDRIYKPPPFPADPKSSSL